MAQKELRLVCGRCGFPFPDLTPVTSDVQERVASLARGGGFRPAMAILGDECGFSLTEAKAVFLHVTRKRGHCNGGGHDLARECSTVNFDWPEAELPTRLIAAQVELRHGGTLKGVLESMGWPPHLL